ncbi:MAG: hypothetical protein ACYTAN_03725 [Planctomycetota bacterium]|jgi:hypothetical protein
MERSHQRVRRLRDFAPYIIAALMIAYAFILLVLVASDAGRTTDLLRSLR